MHRGVDEGIFQWPVDVQYLPAELRGKRTQCFPRTKVAHEQQGSAGIMIERAEFGLQMQIRTGFEPTSRRCRLHDFSDTTPEVTPRAAAALQPPRSGLVRKGNRQ